MTGSSPSSAGLNIAASASAAPASDGALAPQPRPEHQRQQQQIDLPALEVEVEREEERAAPATTASASWLRPPGRRATSRAVSSQPATSRARERDLREAIGDDRQQAEQLGRERRIEKAAVPEGRDAVPQPRRDVRPAVVHVRIEAEPARLPATQ